jgi:YegS/Rv2252/BmrU family lipid kinase
VIALLANPDSGSGGADGVERGLRARGLEVTRFELDRADEVVGASPQRVIVAGGDGSIGCAAEAAGVAGAPLGVVPVGTANDFARALELPDDREEALELAATGRRTACLDLGRVGGRRPFVNAASTGLSPVAARKAHGLKGLLGPLSYTVGALRAGLFAQPVRARVTVDGSSAFDGRAWQVIVGVTGAFGGGAGVDADPGDGKLDVVAIEARSRARLAVHGYGLRAGRVEEQEGVVTASGTRIEVETDGEAGFNVDGELADERRLEFTAEPRAYEVVVGR